MPAATTRPDPAPLVSVVLASYRHADYVETAVRSVLDQTYDRLELIVVDDGSLDGTPDVVEGIHDPRLRLVRIPTNRLTQPRNAGLELASGELVAFQNSDDEWLPDKLERQVAALVADPELVASFTRVALIDESGAPAYDTWASLSFTHELESRLEWLHRFFEDGNDLCISSAVCRRQAVDDLGRFDPSLFHLSDLDLWIRLAAVGELRVVPAELTRMRIVGDRNVSAPTPGTVRRSLTEYAQVLDRFAERPAYKLLPDLFPDRLDRTMRTPIRLAELARMCWEREDVPHRVFADRLFSRLLRTPGYRERIVRKLGYDVVYDFLRARGRLEVVAHD